MKLLEYSHMNYMKYKKYDKQQKRTGRNFSFPDVYNGFKISGGTTNEFDMKTVFLTIHTFVKHTGEEDEKLKDLNYLHYNVRRSLNKHNTTGVFRKEFISDPTIHQSFISTGKGFTQFDYTFFLDKTISFKEVQDLLKAMMDKVNQEIFEVEEKFNFIKDLKKYKKLYGKERREQFAQDFLW